VHVIPDGGGGGGEGDDDEKAKKRVAEKEGIRGTIGKKRYLFETQI
jgi:hypothetical protein